MFGVAPPAPPRSPLCANESAPWLAWYLRYSPPIAKAIGSLAIGLLNPTSPLIVALAWASEERTKLVLSWTMKATASGEMSPKKLAGTQPPVATWQVGLP